MSLLRRLAFSGLVLLTACHFEDRTPAGSRRDEEQIREVIIEYYRGLARQDWGTIKKFFDPDGMMSYLAMVPGDSVPHPVLVPADSALLNWARLSREESSPPGEARILRIDLRQVNRLAAVWVTVRLNLPYLIKDGSQDVEGVEHVVLQRTADGWRIVLLSLPWTVR